MIEPKTCIEVELPESAKIFDFRGGEFAVSEQGEIFKYKTTKKKNKWIKLASNEDVNGRVKVALTAKGWIHTLDVAKTMVEVILEKPVGRSWTIGFLDNNPKNLSLDNFCWQKFQGCKGLGEKIPLMAR